MREAQKSKAAERRDCLHQEQDQWLHQVSRWLLIFSLAINEFADHLRQLDIVWRPLQYRWSDLAQSTPANIYSGVEITIYELVVIGSSEAAAP
jgi:hypothetical protein